MVSAYGNKRRKTETCGNAQAQDVWNQTPGRVTLPRQPGVGRGRVAGHGQVASAASQAKPSQPNQNPMDGHARTYQNKASEHISFLSISPHRSRSPPRSSRDHATPWAHAQAHGPPLPPTRCLRRGSPEMDGSGSWDAIDWNQIEVRPPPLRSLARNPLLLSSRPLRARVCAPLDASRLFGGGVGERRGSAFGSLGGRNATRGTAVRGHRHERAPGPPPLPQRSTRGLRPCWSYALGLAAGSCFRFPY